MSQFRVNLEFTSCIDLISVKRFFSLVRFMQSRVPCWFWITLCSGSIASRFASSLEFTFSRETIQSQRGFLTGVYFLQCVLTNKSCFCGIVLLCFWFHCCFPRLSQLVIASVSDCVLSKFIVFPLLLLIIFFLFIYGLQHKKKSTQFCLEVRFWWGV